MPFGTCWRTRASTESARVRILDHDARPRVVIEDEGPGVPEANLEWVFEPFVRLDGSRSRDTGDVGLGLAIARTIVHGGDIRLENREGGGTRGAVVMERRRLPRWLRQFRAEPSGLPTMARPNLLIRKTHPETGTSQSPFTLFPPLQGGKERRIGHREA